jgi:hypothetical protein
MNHLSPQKWLVSFQATLVCDPGYLKLVKLAGPPKGGAHWEVHALWIVFALAEWFLLTQPSFLTWLPISWDTLWGSVVGTKHVLVAVQKEWNPLLLPLLAKCFK